MRAAKHKGNLDSYSGMSEWAKLKKPKTLQEKESNQDEVYNILRKNGRAKPSYFKTRKLKEIRDGRFLITNDLAHIWGMTDLADGWISCYKRSGCNNFECSIDELDCSKSFLREKSKKSFNEVLNIAISDEKALYNFIHRDMSFLPQNFLDEDGKNLNRNYWDIGLSTMRVGVNYFIFIKVEESDGFDLIKKYKLEESKNQKKQLL